jgi:DNA-binding response OmpR family regulator
MPRQILLIEDEANIAEAIRFVLMRDGWQVSTHGDGSDALERVRAIRPDVLVLDVMLPGRSGFEILSDLRADPEFWALPVLVLTARGQDRERDAALAAGATRFLPKPFGNAELVATLRMLDPGAPGRTAIDPGAA